MIHRILGLHHRNGDRRRGAARPRFLHRSARTRLVKKTVNFDNHHVYHFYYGNERGTPGTIWTTFPYRDRGVRVGVKGAGQVVTTSFSVPATSIDWWRNRFVAHDLTVRSCGRMDASVLQVSDPSGLSIELIGDATDRRPPWTGNGVDAGMAIRGLHSITAIVKELGPTLRLMIDTFGFAIVAQEGARTRLAAGADAPGHYIDVIEDPHAETAVNGLGTVHHVAMSIGSAEEQVRLREVLLEMGLKVTEVRDRCYFTSIYFREPGGVLFEVATTQPGFAVDEDTLTLGRALKLPPWEEEHRADIEAHLVPVRYA
ncbi:MAG: ring-cleaving dioxygenase [Vicinamibacterales bacterium]